MNVQLFGLKTKPIPFKRLFYWKSCDGGDIIFLRNNKKVLRMGHLYQLKFLRPIEKRILSYRNNMTDGDRMPWMFQEHTIRRIHCMARILL